MIQQLFETADLFLLKICNRYPELSAALFGWFVASPVARMLGRALGLP